MTAALNLYADKGESAEVETRIGVLLDGVDNGKAFLLPPKTKKGRSKCAADWITALLEGKSFDEEVESESEKMPAKRKSVAVDGGANKKPRIDEMPLDKESIEADPEAYVGSRVAKYFAEDGLFFGTVQAYKPHPLDDDDDNTNLWKIVYDDSDKEEFDVEELADYMRLYYDHIDQDDKRGK